MEKRYDAMSKKMSKERFLLDKLMQYFMSNENNFKNDELIKLEIYPYITETGDNQYDSLNDDKINWYYVKDEKYKNEHSTANYRIFNKDFLKEDIFKILLNRFGTDGAGLVTPYNEEAAINVLIKYMSEETTYSDKWWHAAEKVYTYWEKGDKRSLYQEATKSITSNEFYFENTSNDENCQLYDLCKEYLCCNGILTDIKCNIRYINLSNKYHNIGDFIKCLGVKHSKDNSCLDLAERVIESFDGQDITDDSNIKTILELLKFIVECDKVDDLSDIEFTLVCNYDLIFKYADIINKYQDSESNEIDGV